MNRTGKKVTLITYEKALFIQAEIRIVRNSTIERKQMSTKTTFKRVALVAVAALGLGVLSVAPSSATTRLDAVSVTAGTISVTQGETATATVSLSVITNSTTTDSVTVTASYVARPSTATSAMRLNVVFVDICFLSIVDLRNFRRSAWN